MRSDIIVKIEELTLLKTSIISLSRRGNNINDEKSLTQKKNKREFLSVERDSSQLLNSSSSQVPRVRASFVAKNPMDEIENCGLKSTIEVVHHNYENLIGYIDSLGTFCMNYHPLFDEFNNRPSLTEIRSNSETLRDENPIALWKRDTRLAFNTIADIISFEINKDKYQNKNQQNLIIRMLHWNSILEGRFIYYFENMSSVRYFI